MKVAIALLLAFLIGAGTRWFDLPVPAPNRLLGAFLILAVTLGYVLTDAYFARTEAPPAVRQQGSGPRS